MDPILVVDDDSGFRQLLETILRGEGYEVETAAKVAEARRACGARAYSLVISDLKMPDGDGLDVEKLPLRAQSPRHAAGGGGQLRRAGAGTDRKRAV